MKRTVWIYALVDPRDFRPRYIGQSRSVLQRLSYHRNYPTSKRTRDWQNEMPRAPMLLLLERVKREWALDAEEWWIDRGRALGWPLLNVARRKKKAAA